MNNKKPTITEALVSESAIEIRPLTEADLDPELLERAASIRDRVIPLLGHLLLREGGESTRFVVLVELEGHFINCYGSEIEPDTVRRFEQAMDILKGEIDKRAH